MLWKYRLQFGIASLLCVTLAIAILCASPRLFVTGLNGLFQKRVVLSGSGWRYEAIVEIAGAVNVVESQITYNGKPIPPTLRVKGVAIKTPIGSFSPLRGQWYPHHSEPAWWSDNYRVPATENGRPWLPQIEYSVPIDEILKNGRFEVPLDSVHSPGWWADHQIKGTPSNWIYVSKESANSYRGFWVDPERLDEFRFE